MQQENVLREYDTLGQGFIKTRDFIAQIDVGMTRLSLGKVVVQHRPQRGQRQGQQGEYRQKQRQFRKPAHRHLWPRNEASCP